LYFQRQPTSRRRKAIVISVDRAQKRGDLHNVERDAQAWEIFLEQKCGFEVLRLKNPDLDRFRQVTTEDSFPAFQKRGNLTRQLVHKIGLVPQNIPRSATVG